MLSLKYKTGDLLVLIMFFFVSAFISAPIVKAESAVRVASPLGISASVWAENGSLMYKIERSGSVILENSALGVVVDGIDLGKGVRLGEPVAGGIDETFPVRGVHATGRHVCGAAKIPVTHLASNTSFSVEIRACDDGVGYRYRVPGAGRRTVNGEASAWRFPANVTFWYQTDTKNYEGVHIKSESVEPGTQIGPPMTIRYADGWYAAVTEAAASPRYSGMTLNALDNNIFKAEFLDDPEGWGVEGEIVTPWRVIIVAKDLNALVNADLVMGLSEPPPAELANAAWIRPGRSLWSYLTSDRVPTPENMRRYVDATAKLGFEYVLVDEGWEKDRGISGWSAPGKTAFDMMGELVAYAKERNVGIWVWKHYSGLVDPAARAEYFDKLARIGVVGVKIDFMDSESASMLAFYESCRRDAAARRLMVNFHGANKPTGESRTWPNEMTREGIRGLEYTNLPPSYQTTLPFTRFLAGHADYTPMHFNFVWMSGSTRAFQLATGVILNSPVTFFGGVPEDYLRSPAREFIESIPTVWDETIVLPASEIGSVVAMARRSKKDWFIAVMNADTPRTVELSLDFLGDGKYVADSYHDPSIKKKQNEVGKGDVLKLQLRAAGGFVARIAKAE